MKSLKFKIANTNYRISGIHLVEKIWNYDVVNENTGVWKAMSKEKLEDLIKKYNAKFF